jgi:indoleamine 2,3-dioxygenase
VKIADRLKLMPYMEYSTSYAVYNYKKINPNGNLDADNVTLIRRLEGSEDEIGFVAVHIAMV